MSEKKRQPRLWVLGAGLVSLMFLCAIASETVSFQVEQVFLSLYGPNGKVSEFQKRMAKYEITEEVRRGHKCGGVFKPADYESLQQPRKALVNVGTVLQFDKTTKPLLPAGFETDSNIKTTLDTINPTSAAANQQNFHLNRIWSDKQTQSAAVAN